MLAISPIYLALVAPLYVVLALRVIRYRRQTKSALGDGGDKQLQKRIRAHGNLSEYAPILLILLVVVELQGPPAFVVHILGALIVASRASHAYFLSQTPENINMRVVNMATTFVLINVMALGLLGHAIF